MAKSYRNRKKLSTVVPGTIFTPDVNALTVSTQINGAKLTVPMKMIEDDPDMFEEVPEYWKPLDGQKYYFIDSNMVVAYTDYKPDEDGTHKLRWEAHNCFETLELAQAALTRVLKVLAKNAI